MKRTTPIAWTEHTVNFWWGCSKVSPACTHCYVETLGKLFGPRLFNEPVLWGAGKPRFERLEAARAECLKFQRQAHESGKPILVFVNSMSDWLDDEVPIDWLAYLLETLHRCPNVRFQLLTKRPENWGVRVLAAVIHMAGYRDGSISSAGPTETPMQGAQEMWEWGKESKAPPNLWLGTTVENQAYAYERIPLLLKIPANVRFLSCEPLLGPVQLGAIRGVAEVRGDWPLMDGTNHDITFPGSPGIHWVIAGGESGGKARPTHPDWFRSLRDQCEAARTPFFFKQWGDYIEAGPNSEHLPTTKTYKADVSLDVTMLKAMAILTGNTLDGVKHEAFPEV